MRLFDRLWPRKKPVITAEFNGILPKEARKKALVARDQFDLTEAEQYLTDEFAAKSA